MFASHSTKVERTAHYYTLGTPGPHIRQFWLICHGYGQLASNLIRKFTDIDDGTTFVLSPEGLSRFYWKGLSGEVGASWMTRHDRLDEIEDYTRFISELFETYRQQLPADVQINFLGFSQGVATQCRWITARQPKFHHLIIWAGLFPEDIDYHPFEAYLADKQIHFVYGDQDQFVTPARIEWQQNFAKEQKLTYQLHTFQGKHEIDRTLLKQLAEGLKD